MNKPFATPGVRQPLVYVLRTSTGYEVRYNHRDLLSKAQECAAVYGKRMGYPCPITMEPLKQ